MSHQHSDQAALPTILFGLIGQSNMEGTNARWANVMDPGVPEDGKIPNAYIWDRIARRDRYSMTEVANLRPLTPGYANGVTPPWTGPDNDYFGPEMSFAMEVQQSESVRVVIIKLAVGGSQVADNGGLNWNVETQGRTSLLNGFLKGYWTPALEDAKRKFGQLTLGGVVSMVGTSDARREKDAFNYSANMAAVIETSRRHILPQSPGDLPWLVIKSPRYEDEDGPIGFIDTVRAGQDRMGVLENVTVQDLANPQFYPDDFVHLNEVGLLNMGRQMALWAGRVIRAGQ